MHLHFNLNILHYEGRMFFKKLLFPLLPYSLPHFVLYRFIVVCFVCLFVFFLQLFLKIFMIYDRCIKDNDLSLMLKMLMQTHVNDLIFFLFFMLLLLL